jgi:uncharacterized protein (DUF2062 family)
MTLRRAAPRLWLWLAKRWRAVRNRLVAVLMAHHGPRMIALGAAAGVFAAVLPLPFLQIVIAVLLASALGANRLAALTTVWVANPVFFYADYLLGRAVLALVAPSLAGGPSVSWPDFLHQVRHSAREVMRGVFLPMLVGAVPLGLVAGAISYWAALRIVTYYRGKLDT